MTLNRPATKTTEREKVIQDWMKDIQKVARRAAFDWPGIVEQEDMVQDVCLHIMESPGTQRDLSEMDDDSRYRTLHKIAQRIASGDRTDYEYFSGQFRYSVNEVRRVLDSGLLETVGIGSSWSSEDYISDGGGEHDAVLSMVSRDQDLRNAMAELGESTPRYHDVLTRRYLLGEALSDNDQKALSRALASLTAKMNHWHKRQHANRVDGPGTRRAISTDTARRMSSQQYNGDYDKTGAGWSTRTGEF